MSGDIYVTRLSVKGKVGHVKAAGHRVIRPDLPVHVTAGVDVNINVLVPDDLSHVTGAVIQ